MFNWLVTKTGQKEEYHIPTPPEPNLEVALRVKRKKYISSYYPEDLKEEIKEAYIEREMRKMNQNDFKELFSRDFRNEYRKREERRILKKYFMANLSKEMEKEWKNRKIFFLAKNTHKMLMCMLSEEIKGYQVPVGEVDEYADMPDLIPVGEVDEYADLIPVEEIGERIYKGDLLKDIVDKLKNRVPVEEVDEMPDLVEDSNSECESSEEFFPTKKIEESSEEEYVIIPNKNLKEESSEEEYIIQTNKRARNEQIPEFEWDKKITEWGLDASDFQPFDFVKNEEITEEDMTRISKEIGENWSIRDHKIKREYPEGYFEIYMGPMFSGKSSKLLFKLSSMADQRFNCLYINSIKDVRKTESQDDAATTHNSSYSKLSSKITSMKVSSLREVDVSDFDYIAIDELQFFDDEHTIECIENWISIYGKYVLVASLDGDCYRRKFGRVLDLIPLADEIYKLTAYCDLCRDNYGILKKAPFTARMTSDRTAELVGGSDMYKAMCRKCHDFHIDITSHYIYM